VIRASHYHTLSLLSLAMLRQYGQPPKPASQPPHQHQLLQAGSQVLLAVGHLARHNLLLQLPVYPLVHQDETASRIERENRTQTRFK
jgi:hypothetical protein